MKILGGIALAYPEKKNLFMHFQRVIAAQTEATT